MPTQSTSQLPLAAKPEDDPIATGTRIGEAIIRAVTPQEDPTVGLFERLAKDPNVDVEKLERLIAMQERVMRHNAEAAFNVAFTAMQPDIPTILERAKTDKTSYAPLEDIIEPLRPVLMKHGFSLGFRTEWPNEKTVKVIGILTHNEGHARTSEFLSAADQTGSKNAIQALASAVSYGKRYTTKDLLCIVTRGEDDDARRAGNGKTNGEIPAGFEQWWDDFQAVADNGTVALEKAWKDANQNPKLKACAAYASKTKRDTLNALKVKAARVAAS